MKLYILSTGIEKTKELLKAAVEIGCTDELTRLFNFFGVENAKATPDLTTLDHKENSVEVTWNTRKATEALNSMEVTLCLSDKSDFLLADTLFWGSVVRNNLMNDSTYRPYCGNDRCMHRTTFVNGQFECRCG